MLLRFTTASHLSRLLQTDESNEHKFISEKFIFLRETARGERAVYNEQYSTYRAMIRIRIIGVQ